MWFRMYKRGIILSYSFGFSWCPQFLSNPPFLEFWVPWLTLEIHFRFLKRQTEADHANIL